MAGLSARREANVAEGHACLYDSKKVGGELGTIALMKCHTTCQWYEV